VIFLGEFSLKATFTLFYSLKREKGTEKETAVFVIVGS